MYLMASRTQHTLPGVVCEVPPTHEESCVPAALLIENTLLPTLPLSLSLSDLFESSPHHGG